LNTVERWMRDAGVMRGISKVNPQDVIDFIAKNPKMMQKDVAAHFGVVREVIRRIMRAHGISEDLRRRTHLGRRGPRVRKPRGMPSVEPPMYPTGPPSAYLGFYTPVERDPDIKRFNWAETKQLGDDPDVLHLIQHGGEHVSAEGVPTDETPWALPLPPGGLREPIPAFVRWDIDGVEVTVIYGPYSEGKYPRDVPAGDVALVDISRKEGETSAAVFRKIGDLLDGIHRDNPGIRIIAEVIGDVRRGDIRARVYESGGWVRRSETAKEGSVLMEYPSPEERNPQTPTAFDGIAAYADAIMELV